MRMPMSVALVSLLALSTALAQTSTNTNQELPSAPSAVAAKPATPSPSQPVQPANQPPAQDGATTTASSQPAAAAPAPSTSVPASATDPVYPASKTQPDTPPSTASNTSPASTDDDNQPLTTIRARVDEVNVVFTVTDKHGRFVKDLTKNDFQVLDDHKPPKAIEGFTSETNLPLRVGLLVDSSNSVRDRFRFEQDAAIEFLNQIIRPRSDKAFVIGFDTTAEVTTDFTDSTDQLSRGVRMLRAGGGTALYDAVYFACRDKLMKQTGGPMRKAIILLSDGEDNQSRVTREEAVEMAQRAEVIIYTISTNVSGTKMRGDKILERLADATGGRAFFPFKIQDVANAFSEISDELRSQYAIAYRPSDFKADGSFRSIDIIAENHKNLHVRARKGYFAPNQ